uniref:Reverse transcriptase domain-containing protein n=1 Tax=Periophthalmus magnuspinnatus TaxID=409849 RepID=A0A3B3ZH10_9GOBI
KLSGFIFSNVNFTVLIIIKCSLIKKNQNSLPWMAKGLRNLGINISQNPSQLFTASYDKITKEISIDLKRWEILPLILMGRIEVIRTNVLPEVLFLLSKETFTKMDKIASKFIWRKQNPRIRYKLLQKDGGKWNKTHTLKYSRFTTISYKENAKVLFKKCIETLLMKIYVESDDNNLDIKDKGAKKRNIAILEENWEDKFKDGHKMLNGREFERKSKMLYSIVPTNTAKYSEESVKCWRACSQTGVVRHIYSGIVP